MDTNQSLEALAQAVFSAHPDGLLVVALDGTIRSANRRAGILLGYPPPTLPTGGNVFDLILQQEWQRARSDFLKAAQEPVSLTTEHVLVTPSGNHVTLDISLSAIDSLGPEPLLIMALRTTTGRGQAERVARDGEYRLKAALDSVADGAWDYDAVTRSFSHSPAWHRHLGYAPGSIGKALEDFIRHIHPEERSSVQTQLDEHMQGRTHQFKVEYRFINKQGDWVWVQSRGRASSGESGSPSTRMVGTHTDLTGQRAAGQALLKTSNETGPIMARIRLMAGQMLPEDLMNLSDILITSIQTNGRAIMDSARRRDAPAMHRAAHSLKGTSYQFGAIPLGDLCKRIDEVGRGGSVDGIEEELDLLLVTCVKTANIIREVLKESIKELK